MRFLALAFLIPVTSFAVTFNMTEVTSYLEARKNLDVATIESKRTSYFQSACGATAFPYEYCFEGGNLPGEATFPMHLWDNPTDDDWRFGIVRGNDVKINQTLSGTAISYLQAYRWRRPDTLNPEGKRVINGTNGPFWLSKRDHLITPESGFDMLISLRISNDSPDKKVLLSYEDAENKFSIAFNRQSVILSPSGGALFHYATDILLTSMHGSSFDLRNGFHTFRVVKEPLTAAVNAGQVVVYYWGPTLSPVSQRHTPVYVFSPTESAASNAGSNAIVSFGNVSDDVPEDQYFSLTPQGQYDLDFLRLGRRLVSPRTKPALPIPAASEAWETAYQAWSTAISQFAATSIEFGTNDWPDMGINTPAGHIGGGRISGLLNREGNDMVNRGFTIEWKMKFLSSSAKQHMSYLHRADHEGKTPGYSYSIVVSNNSVQAKNYGKPVGSRPFAMDSGNGQTMAEWRCFRLVKPANSSYAQLYMDGNPIPLLPDIAGAYSSSFRSYVKKTDGTEFINVGSRLNFGTMENTVPETSWSFWNTAPFLDMPGMGTNGASNIRLAYIRLSEQVMAPQSGWSCPATPADNN